jgi:hypothetical protein
MCIKQKLLATENSGRLLFRYRQVSLCSHVMIVTTFTHKANVINNILGVYLHKKGKVVLIDIIVVLGGRDNTNLKL